MKVEVAEFSKVGVITACEIERDCEVIQRQVETLNLNLGSMRRNLYTYLSFSFSYSMTSLSVFFFNSAKE